MSARGGYARLMHSREKSVVYVCGSCGYAHEWEYDAEECCRPEVWEEARYRCTECDLILEDDECDCSTCTCSMCMESSECQYGCPVKWHNIKPSGMLECKQPFCACQRDCRQFFGED